MKNKITFFSLLFAFLVLFNYCRTSPPAKVKIIEEHDPVVKNIEEKDSMRIIPPDTLHNKKTK